VISYSWLKERWQKTGVSMDVSFAINWRAQGQAEESSHSFSMEGRFRGGMRDLSLGEGFLDRGVYKISLSHVGFALLGTSRPSSCLADERRKLLKTFILIAGCANKGNWHFPCKTKGGIGRDQRLSRGLHHRVRA
jgi:hypothetical protein